MTANLSNQPQDYSMFMSEIAQLRKEISEAKQQQQQFSPSQQGQGASSSQQQQPQYGTQQQQLGAGAGAGAGKKQGKAQTMSDMKNTLDRFNESLRSLYVYLFL